MVSIPAKVTACIRDLNWESLEVIQLTISLEFSMLSMYNKLYENDQIVKHRDLGYIYGIEPYETIAAVLSEE